MPLRSFNWGTDASCNDLKGGDRGGGAIMDVKTLCLGVFTLGKLLAPDKFQSKIPSLSFLAELMPEGQLETVFETYQKHF